jgi:hypothetical protein
MSKGIEDTAIRIIQHSMAKGWKGLFEIKNENNGDTKTQQTRTSPKVTEQQLNEAFFKRSHGG